MYSNYINEIYFLIYYILNKCFNVALCLEALLMTSKLLKQVYTGAT